MRHYRNTIIAISIAAAALAITPDREAGAATAMRGGNLETMRARASELFRNEQYDEALPIIKEILSINPGDSTALRYKLIFDQNVKEPQCKQAAAAYFSGNTELAVSHWNKILKIDPSDSRVQDLINRSVTETDRDAIERMFSIVDQLLNEGRRDEAVNEMLKILEMDPTEQRAQRLLQSLKTSEQDSSIKGHYSRAKQHIDSREYDQAISELRTIVELAPDQELAMNQIAYIKRLKLEDQYNTAHTLYATGEFIEARDHLNRLLAENPMDSALVQTVDRLNEAIKAAPEIGGMGERASGAIKKSLSNYIADDGDPEVSVATAWYASQIEPNNPTVKSVRNLIETKNVSTVLKMEAPREDMNLVDQYLYDSLNHIYEGKYDKAIRECRLVLEIDENNILALKRLGSAYYLMGKKQQASGAWRRALGMAPADEELKEFLALVD